MALTMLVCSLALGREVPEPPLQVEGVSQELFREGGGGLAAAVRDRRGGTRGALAGDFPPEVEGVRATPSKTTLHDFVCRTSAANHGVHCTL